VVLSTPGTPGQTIGVPQTLPNVSTQPIRAEAMIYWTRNGLNDLEIPGTGPDLTSAETLNYGELNAPVQGIVQDAVTPNVGLPANTLTYSAVSASPVTEAEWIKFTAYSPSEALPSVPPINDPQFFLIGVVSTELSLPGQFRPANPTSELDASPERQDQDDLWSFWGDFQPKIDAAPYQLEGEVWHDNPSDHLDYLILLRQALIDANAIEYRIAGATYRLFLDTDTPS
jgi:hypothetical protein